MARLLKLFVASLLAAPWLAAAAVPGSINFSARIADNGQPVVGDQSFTFKLWTVATGGNAGADDVWTEGPRTIAVTDGVVATALGDVANGGTALPTFSGADLFLEVTMGSTTFPRLKLQSVPYALRAGVADRLAGFETAPTRLLSVAAAGCAYYGTAPAIFTRTAGYCYLSDGTNSYRAEIPVQLPANATLEGMQVYGYATGTISCMLIRVADWLTAGTSIATATKTGTGFAYGAETTFTHAVDNAEAYVIECFGSGTTPTNVVSSIRLRYTLAGP